uniref:Uncharacterized protein n=1 Tax=Anopheles dirus TaxID=7168 RepID=A0A182N6S5_9DIPT
MLHTTLNTLQLTDRPWILGAKITPSQPSFSLAWPTFAYHSTEGGVCSKRTKTESNHETTPHTSGPHQQMDGVGVAPQRRLVLELRPTVRTLVGKVLRVDPYVVGPLVPVRVALAAHPAPILAEREAHPTPDVSGQRRGMLELGQTVRAVVLPAGGVRPLTVLRQSGHRREGFRTVPAPVLPGCGPGCILHRPLRW